MACVLSFVDVVVIVWRDFSLSWLGWGELLLEAGGLASLFALLLYGALCLWSALTAFVRRGRGLSDKASIVIDSLPVIVAELVCGYMLVAPVWSQQSTGMKAAWLLGAAFVAVGGVAVTGLFRLTNNCLTRWAGIAGLLLAATLYGVDVTVLAGLYPALHVGVFIGLLRVGYLASNALVRNPPRLPTRWVLLALAVLALYPLFLLSSTAASASIIATHGILTGKVLNSGRALTDFDGDGFSALFAGGDCAEFCAEVHPHALDIPSNGIDEDCSGADLVITIERGRRTTLFPLSKGTYNVVLVLIDAFRADHVAALGYPRKTTPNIDQLASRSQLFSRAYSQSSKTATSVPSILTGRYPSNLVMDFSNPKYPVYAGRFHTSNVTLTERLKKAGYGTVLGTRNRMYRSYDFTHGFDKINTKKIGSIKSTAHNMLRRRGKQPFFLMLHLMDPHEPYVRHPEHDFGPTMIDRYDSDIAAADEFVGALINRLVASKRMENTIFIVTGDHGESLGEMGRLHHIHLHEETLHVPLVMFVPGLSPRVFDKPTGLVDIVPTVLELLGLAPVPLVDGTSLAPYFFGEPYPGSAVISQRRERKGVTQNSLVRGNYRLTLGKGGVQLIDVVHDRKGERNLAKIHPEITRELRELLASRIQAVESAVLQRASESKTDMNFLSKQVHRFGQPTLLNLGLDLIKASGAGDRVVWKQILTRADLPEPLRLKVLEMAP
jgi:arylsulfatase A-like enzyme